MAGTTGTNGMALLPLQRPTIPPLLLMLLDFCSGLILGNLDMLHSHSRENSRGFGSILAPSADSVAIFVEESRKGDAGQRQKGGNGARPVNAQVRIHVASEEGEGSTKERSEDGAGSQR